MTRKGGPESPSSSVVLRAQVRTVASARYRVLLTVGWMPVFLFGSDLYAAFVRGVTDLNSLVMLGGGAFGFIAVIAVFWALSVWHQETPSRRLYHWSMPVARGAHDRIRVVAGALWLVAGIAAFVLGTVLVALITGQAGELGARAATLWVNYFTGAITLYLLTIVPALRSERPFAWVVGVSFSGTLLPLGLDGMLTMDGALIHLWSEVMVGPFGLGTALVGGIMRGPWGSPGWDVWLAPMLLWLGLSVAAVYAATLREPDA